MTKLGSRKLNIYPKGATMGSIIGHRIDYNGVAFSIELLEWAHIFSNFWGKKIRKHLQLANIPECLYCW